MGNYWEDWRVLNRELRTIETESGDLRAAFSSLHTHQIASGFLRQDFDSIERFSFCHPEKGHRCFHIQYNPNRAKRFSGAGVKSAPEPHLLRHDGCYLCRDNIRWQQQGRQFGYRIDANGNAYIAWMNPFPLLPGHIVIAAEDHIGQEWSLHPGGKLEPARIIADLVRLAARAPGYAGFYNGVGAGTSIPAHLHYHFFRPPEEHGKFPLEVEAIGARAARPGKPYWHLGNYPLEAVHWHGPPGEIIKQSTRWLDRWVACQHNLPELAANILTITDEPGDAVSLFFVPRNRRRCQTSCMSGLVGGLEVLGELVFSTAEDKEWLDSGRLDYFNLEQVLAEVCTPLNMPW